VRSMIPRRLCRLLPAVLVALVAAALPPAAHAASGCPGGDNMPAELGTSAVRRTTLCLLNAERSAQGVPPLRQDMKLARAARRHSRDMVAHLYFAHESRSGAPFSARIARTGWMRSRTGWSLGENLGWGSDALATPQAMMTAWMHSAAHRKNLLQRRFHVVGIGVANGVPITGGAAGDTYTTDFGS
jgi:uncharacterized protein YkwD